MNKNEIIIDEEKVREELENGRTDFAIKYVNEGVKKGIQVYGTEEGMKYVLESSLKVVDNISDKYFDTIIKIYSDAINNEMIIIQGELDSMDKAFSKCIDSMNSVIKDINLSDERAVDCALKIMDNYKGFYREQVKNIKKTSLIMRLKRVLGFGK